MDIQVDDNLIKRRYKQSSIWYGPALNSPGHERHGQRPMVDRSTGRHIGWMMPEIRKYHNRQTQLQCIKREIETLNDTALELIAGVVADLLAEGRAT